MTTNELNLEPHIYQNNSNYTRIVYEPVQNLQNQSQRCHLSAHIPFEFMLVNQPTPMDQQPITVPPYNPGTPPQLCFPNPFLTYLSDSTQRPPVPPPAPPPPIPPPSPICHSSFQQQPPQQQSANCYSREFCMRQSSFGPFQRQTRQEYYHYQDQISNKENVNKCFKSCQTNNNTQNEICEKLRKWDPPIRPVKLFRPKIVPRTFNVPTTTEPIRKEQSCQIGAICLPQLRPHSLKQPCIICRKCPATEAREPQVSKKRPIPDTIQVNVSEKIQAPYCSIHNCPRSSSNEYEITIANGQLADEGEGGVAVCVQSLEKDKGCVESCPRKIPQQESISQMQDKKYDCSIKQDANMNKDQKNFEVEIKTKDKKTSVEETQNQNKEK